MTNQTPEIINALPGNSIVFEGIIVSSADASLEEIEAVMTRLIERNKDLLISIKKANGVREYLG